MFLALVLIVLGGPDRELRAEYDVVRQGDVGDVMEVMLDLELSDREEFAGVVGQVTDRRVMLGTGVDCSGDVGTVCTDEGLADACLDLSGYFEGHDPDVMPVDPRDGEFTMERTGYYISFVDGLMEIGSCNPESMNGVFLQKRFGLE